MARCIRSDTCTGCTVCNPEPADELELEAAPAFSIRYLSRGLGYVPFARVASADELAFALERADVRLARLFPGHTRSWAIMPALEGFAGRLELKRAAATCRVLAGVAPKFAGALTGAAGALEGEERRRHELDIAAARVAADSRACGKCGGM